MAEISEFRRWVAVACESVPTPLLDEAIRAAAERLCRYAGVWGVQHPPITVIDGTTTYNITAPAGAQLIRIEGVHLNGRPLAPADPAWGSQYTGGNAAFAFWLEPATDASAPAVTVGADAVGTLEFRAIYAPLKTATEVPDFLYDEYEEGIAAGAISQLLSIPGKAWTDQTASEEFRRKFMRCAGAAKLKAATGNTNNVLPPAHTGYFGG